MPRVLRDIYGYPIISGEQARGPTSIVDDGASILSGEFADEFADEFDTGQSITGVEIADDAGEFIVDDGIAVTQQALPQFGPYVEATAASGVTGLAFIVATIQATQPASGGASLSLPVARNSAPWNANSLVAATVSAIATTATIAVSDVGYRSLAGDLGGIIPYPPLIVSSFQIDREINLDPTGTAAAWGWGTLTLSNDDGRFDAMVTSWNTDGRPMTLSRGLKTWDDQRGMWLDPSISTLAPLFAGMSGPWQLATNTLSVPVRDATYWLERPYQPNTYGGSGTYDGNAALISTAVPRTRGGNALHPVKNVTPVLIDPVNLIYQYNDAAGTVVTLYEGAKTGAGSYISDGNVADLYSGSVASGHYRTNNARGLFQLGSLPTYAITADVTGEFPTAGAITNIVDIARYILTEDIGLPIANLDTASFTVGALAYPYVGGIYFPPGDNADGPTAVSRPLISLGAKLIPDRVGKLRFFALRALTGSESPAIILDRTNCANVVPMALPSNVDPPAYRVRLAWQHNNTVQTSGVNPTATAAQTQFIAQPDTYAVAISATTALKYLKPGDISPIGGALLVQADAQAVVNAIGALWSVRRRLYEVTMPVAVAINLELGNIVRLVYPMDDLRNGQLGQIVGDKYDSSASTIVFRVLV